MYPINVVEKEVNISKYLLRMWERRYSFPRPLRDLKGERIYTSDDVEKLKLIKSLMVGGYRPSKIINQSLAELQDLSKTFTKTQSHVTPTLMVLVTRSELLEEVQLALKNQGVMGVFYINEKSDIENLIMKF